MKDLRCLLNLHAWKKKHIEDSAYLECSRCGKQTSPPTRGPMGTGGGFGM
jgi:hypothetical protein